MVTFHPDLNLIIVYKFIPGPAWVFNPKSLCPNVEYISQISRGDFYCLKMCSSYAAAFGVQVKKHPQGAPGDGMLQTLLGD